MAAEAYYRQIKERSARPETWLSTDKPPRRILWIHFAPLHAGDVMRYFEKDIGMPDRFRHPRLCLLADAERRGSDSGFSKKVLSHFFLTGSSGQRMRLYRRLIEDYRIDGAVFFYASRLPGDPRSFLGAANDNRREKSRFWNFPVTVLIPAAFPANRLCCAWKRFWESMDLHTNRKGEKDVLGIDSGSTSVNVLLLNDEKIF